MTNKSAYDIATTFPDQKATVKRVIKEKKQELGKLLALERFIKEKCSKDLRHYNKCLVQSFNTYGIYGKKAQLEQSITFNKKILKVMEIKERGDTNSSWLDATALKDRPISDFLDFNRAGFACCIWHNEKTPSMKYYPKEGRVWCFGCQKGGDVIDVVMEINKLSFKEALSFIVKH